VFKKLKKLKKAYVFFYLLIINWLLSFYNMNIIYEQYFIHSYIERLSSLSGYSLIINI